MVEKAVGLLMLRVERVSCREDYNNVLKNTDIRFQRKSCTYVQFMKSKMKFPNTFSNAWSYSG